MRTFPLLFSTYTIVATASVLIPRQGSSGTISYHDYSSLAGSSSAPMCGMPYSSLSIEHIVSVGGFSKANCGTCLNVCGPTNQCATFLAVDGKAGGLDLPTGPVAGSVFDGAEGTSPDPPGFGSVEGTWTPVDASQCASYWTGETTDQLYGSLGEYTGDGTEGQQQQQPTEGAVASAAPVLPAPVVVPSPPPVVGSVNIENENNVPVVVTPPAPVATQRCRRGRCWG